MRLSFALPAIVLSVAGMQPSGIPFAIPTAAAMELSLQDFCSDPGTGSISICLETLLQYHCAYLSGGNPWNWGACASATHEAVPLLDLENLSLPSDSSPGLRLHVTAFSHSLEPVFAAASTGSWLQDLIAKTDAAYRFDEPASLWTSTRGNSPRAERLRLLGVVFQSVTPVTGENLHFHLLRLRQIAQVYSYSGHYLERSRQILRNISLYQQLTDQWRRTKIEASLNPAFSLYPPFAAARDLDPTLHHFYVPAHLAGLLLKAGENPKMAFFVPFLFNTLYEMRKIDRKLGLGNWPYSYPSRLPGGKAVASVEINLRKIYTGYAGASFGAGMESRIMGYQEFRERFVTDPYSTLQGLLE